MSELGSSLLTVRTTRGETQAEVARLFGITQPSYHRWEAGTNNPDARHFADIAKYLQVDVGQVWTLVHSPVEQTETLADQVGALEAAIDEAKRFLSA